MLATGLGRNPGWVEVDFDRARDFLVEGEGAASLAESAGVGDYLFEVVVVETELGR